MRVNGDVPIACSSRARCSSRSRACPRGELVEESVGSSATSRDSSRLRGGGSRRGAAWPRGLLRTAGETVADTSSCAGTTARFFAWPEAASGTVVAFLFFTPSRVVVVVAWTAATTGRTSTGASYVPLRRAARAPWPRTTALTASKESGRRRGARPRGGVDEEDFAADDAMALWAEPLIIIGLRSVR